MTGYADLDATALAALVRDGEVHPRELVQSALAALDQVDPALNATVHRMDEDALDAADGDLPEGPFRGVPFVIKDLDGFAAGLPYTMSSRFLVDFVPDHDAEVIRRLRASGLLFIARTNCPELGIMGTTESELRGPAHNPWNPEHTPGGSSGGSGALVAARVVPMGHGGDGGGSIRIPASANGVFGMKATRARVPLGPDLGEGWGGLVTPGVITRSVRDSAAVLDVMRTGDDVGAPYQVLPPERPYVEEVGRDPGRLRIAFYPGSLFGRTIGSENIEAVQSAARACEALGHEVVEACPDFDRDALVRAYFVLVSACTAAEIHDAGEWVGRTPTWKGFEGPTWLLNQLGHALSAADLQRARDQIHAASRQIAPFFAEHDVFLCSTLAHPPARLGELLPKWHERLGLAALRTLPLKAVMMRVLGDLADSSMEATPNTQLFNMTGQPAMSVPLHWSQNGLPIGVQFAGRFGDEATLFRLAAQLETAHPWSDRKPPICAG